MSPTLELVAETGQEPRDRRIRTLFKEVGGSMGTAAFARLCIEEGIWSGDELDRIQIRAAQAEIRSALKANDSSGLPFAGITTERDETGAPVWQQRTLWHYADYELNIHDLLVQRDQCEINAERLMDECRERFGRVPSLALRLVVDEAS